MPTLAEQFFDRLTTVQDLERLIGQSEDAMFDCKQWGTLNENRGSIAKAACGFTNATGGVIVIGLEASGRGPDTPDVVQSLKPVSSPNAVLSQVLDIIVKFVEPGIEGVSTKVVDHSSPGQGFVIVHVPASDGSVRRTRTDWKFYVRIASGTLPMEYFQIEERFGRRSVPNLRLELVPHEMRHGFRFVQQWGRHFDIWLQNDGRGLARFPGIRIKSSTNMRSDDSGIDGTGVSGLPLAASENTSILFRGGADHVIYPGERFLAGSLIQTSSSKDEGLPQSVYMGYFPVRRTYTCEPIQVECEIYSENMQTKIVSINLPEDSQSEDLKISPSHPVPIANRRQTPFS